MSTPGPGGIVCREVTTWDALKAAYKASAALAKVIRYVPVP